MEENLIAKHLFRPNQDLSFGPISVQESAILDMRFRSLINNNIDLAKDL